MAPHLVLLHTDAHFPVYDQRVICILDLKMASKSISKKRREEYIELLHSSGEEKMYQAVIGIGMKSSAVCNNPEDQILDESDAMLFLYRRTGKEEYLAISKLLRKAAHVVHRQLMIQNANKKPNRKRFLYLLNGQENLRF